MWCLSADDEAEETAEEREAREAELQKIYEELAKEDGRQAQQGSCWSHCMRLRGSPLVVVMAPIACPSPTAQKSFPDRLSGKPITAQCMPRAAESSRTRSCREAVKPSKALPQQSSSVQTQHNGWEHQRQAHPQFWGASSLMRAFLHGAGLWIAHSCMRLQQPSVALH